MMTLASRYCSWCYTPGPHHLFKTTLARSLYQCDHCKNRTLVCIVPKCMHMAKAGERWDDNLCAEHDGSVPNMSLWTRPLSDIVEFNDVIHADATNFLAIPHSTIFGKLGRLLPLPISDFRALEHFAIRKISDGAQHGITFVNGFLSEAETDTCDWTGSTKQYFEKATCYHLDWEATRHLKNALPEALASAFVSIANSHILFAGANIAASWHLSMKNAEVAGRLLASAILRTPDWSFTLAGHSLGARVIHFALVELAKHGSKRIENAYLLGAAVGGGGKDDDCWRQAANAVRGKIFNCFSSEDSTLAMLYRGANVMVSRPAGYSGIHLEHAQVINVDCSDFVKAHTLWKSKFGEIIRRLEH